MSIFICEKCGKLDNTACGNNYWHALANKARKEKGEELETHYKPEFSYFETHVCCSDCCDGVTYSDDSGTLHNRDIDIKDKDHWTKFGKEKLLEWEKRNDGSMENATEYFKSVGELQNASTQSQRRLQIRKIRQDIPRQGHKEESTETSRGDICKRIQRGKEVKVKIISGDSYRTRAFIGDREISGITTGIQFEQYAGKVPTFTFETAGLPNIEIENADIRFRFVPETIKDSARVICHSFSTNRELYDAFVASIASALKEVPAGTGLYDVAQAVADRIIGREE